MRVRGPLGPPRWDHDVAKLAMYAGSPYPESVTMEDFQQPWEHTATRGV